MLNQSKKYLTVFIAVIGLTMTASAITIEDVSIDPDIPDHNDTVDVKAFVDGEGKSINSVDVDIRENNNIIVEDKPLDYVSGRLKELQLYRDNNTFTVNSNDSERFIYDMNVQAIDSEGNTDSLTFTLDVRENETIIDIEEPSDDTTENTLFGIRLIDLLVTAIILMFTWTIATDQRP